MLRERPLKECVAEIDTKLAAARAEPQDNRAINVDIGVLEHVRTALLIEGGNHGPAEELPAARALPPEAGDEPS